MKIKNKPISIYIHIPFCVRKCLYCDFLSAPAKEDEKERYLRCLEEEIKREAKNYVNYEVQTVFIGGGTPSLLLPEEAQRLLNAVRQHYRMAGQAEITIEVNPGTANFTKLKAYYEMGINRLSIGLQSAINEELKCLGRIHTWEDFLKTYKDAVKSGFNNINVDLMSAIPMQTVESFRETLSKVLLLQPQPAHISAYSLIIEEGTPFYENTPELPDEETDRLMYKITDDILKRNGYHRYEISNYAQKSMECRHNKVYWTRGDYVGFGIGAASLVNNVRFHNLRDIKSYIHQMEADQENGVLSFPVKEDIEQLSWEEQIEEYMFLGLRLTEGISLKAFFNTFGKTLDEVYPGLIERLVSQGLLLITYGKNKEAERIFLSEYGLDVSNRVMAEFLLTVEN